MKKKNNITHSYFTNLIQTNLGKMPFWVEATGINCLKKGYIEKKPPLQSSTIDFCWGINGTGRVNVGGAKAVIEKDGIFLSYPFEERQKEGLSNEWEYRWLTLTGPLACAIVMSYGFPRFMSSYVPYPTELFAQLDELFPEKSLFAQRRAAALVLDIFAHADGCSILFSKFERLVVRAEEYIKQNLGNPELTAEHIADYFKVSRVTLNKAYREHNFPSPGRRILDLRLIRARELIYGTDLSVVEISRLCGFSDPHTFTRFIKRSLGAPPLQCRKKKVGVLN